MSGELVYNDTQLRTIEYRLKNKYKLVIFPSERKVNLVSLYTELSLKEGITVISLLNKYYNKLKVVPELIESNIIADNYERTYTKVKIEELDDESKRYFNLVVDFVYDKIFNKVILNVILVKENIYLYRQKEKEIIVPVKALEYVKECCIKIVNTLPNGENIKDEILKCYIDLEAKVKRKCD